VLGGQVVQTLSLAFQFPGALHGTHLLLLSKYGALVGHSHLLRTVLTMKLDGQVKQVLVSLFQKFGLLQATHLLLLSRYLRLVGQTHDKVD
jgi:hypothetical protein